MSGDVWKSSCGHCGRSSDFFWKVSCVPFKHRYPIKSLWINRSNRTTNCCHRMDIVNVEDIPTFNFPFLQTRIISERKKIIYSARKIVGKARKTASIEYEWLLLYFFFHKVCFLHVAYTFQAIFSCWNAHLRKYWHFFHLRKFWLSVLSIFRTDYMFSFCFNKSR